MELEIKLYVHKKQQVKLSFCYSAVFMGYGKIIYSELNDSKP